MFKEFTVELFPRLLKATYPDQAAAAECRYITWKTSHQDIAEQRSRGVKGAKYRVYPKHVNMNRGKYHMERALWNKTFHRWLPAGAIVTSSCEWRERKVYERGGWEYQIVKVEKL